MTFSKWNLAGIFKTRRLGSFYTLALFVIALLFLLLVNYAICAASAAQQQDICLTKYVKARHSSHTSNILACIFRMVSGHPINRRCQKNTKNNTFNSGKAVRVGQTFIISDKRHPTRNWTTNTLVCAVFMDTSPIFGHFFLVAWCRMACSER